MLLVESIRYDCHNCEKEEATVVIGRSAVHRVFDSAARGRSGGPIASRGARFLYWDSIEVVFKFCRQISWYIKNKTWEYHEACARHMRISRALYFWNRSWKNDLPIGKYSSPLVSAICERFLWRRYPEHMNNFNSGRKSFIKWMILRNVCQSCSARRVMPDEELETKNLHFWNHEMFCGNVGCDLQQVRYVLRWESGMTRVLEFNVNQPWTVHRFLCNKLETHQVQPWKEKNAIKIVFYNFGSGWFLHTWRW